MDDLNESQEAAVMGIVRSAVVCLHSLLILKQQGDCDDILNELFIDHLSHSREISSSESIKLQNQHIIENLSIILFDEKFDNFRTKLINKLEENNQHGEIRLFQERLNIARSLPDDTKSITNEVIASLKENKQNFLDWLFFKFLESEHYTTQHALIELIFNYLPNAYYAPANQITTDNIYTIKHIQAETYFPLYKDLRSAFNDNKLSTEERDNIIELLQMLKSGILVYSDSNYAWRVNSESEIDNIDLSELKDILRLAKNYPGEDLSEKVSLLLDFSEDPLITKFKQSKLKQQVVEEKNFVKRKIKLC